MTTRKHTPSPAAGIEVAPLLILVGLVGGGVLFSVVWLGGTLGAVLVGGGWAPPPYTPGSAVALARGGFAALWPTAPTGSAVGAVAFLVLGVTGFVAGAVALVHRFARRDGLGGPREMAALGRKQAERRARQLRPELATVKQIAPRDRGVPLARLDPSGGEMTGSDEDTYTAVMGPRAGKTSGLAVPILLDAPGPALLTSNRNDAYAVTFRQRAREGHVFTFDLQQIVHAERDTWVDLLPSARSVEGATRLAMHFTNGTEETRKADDFWNKAGSNTLMCLFHAAAISGGTLHDVMAWLDTPSDRAPVNALKHHNPLMASRLRATVEGAIETRDGIYETARQATACLLDPDILAWVTPDKNREPFRPYDFVTSTDTLYLLSKDGGGSAAAITAALADLVFRAGTMAAERNGTGRLAVPLRAILDESANVCRIADLPQLYSHLGGRGITPFCFLQSYKQGSGVWGDNGMDALWTASTVKLLGAGQDDAQFTENVAKLIGKHKVPDVSTTHGQGGRSTSMSPHEEDILQPAQVRELERGKALLWASGTPMARVKLTPWMAGPDAQRLRTDHAAEAKAIAHRAENTPVIL